MDYKDILNSLNVIQNDVKKLCDNEYPEVKPYMSVVEFGRLVDESILQVRERKSESELFRQMFNNDDYYENLSSYMKQLTRSLVAQIEKNGVYTDVNNNMQKNLSNVTSLIEVLTAEYQTLLKADKKNYFKKNTAKLEEIASIVKTLAIAQKNITMFIRYNSAIIANVILKNFKSLFKFFNNAILLAKSRQDELLLIEIAGMSDLIVSNVSPVLSSGKSLKQNELIYHSLIYELKRLRKLAIDD
ncbi:hypothetical protein [Campylobacter sp. 19-13652]|uniref:hypothetical protein n=1 Tax=Campylobacter sp. 19-13652 TaxID=2840180 RepID=UPI001C793150|nr:hypothetical protein [Campylobacter sp. 19-13652]BCX79676.1 hypothetical protein LBC_11380 [Campylobacter sp. 19-13652]